MQMSLWELPKIIQQKYKLNIEETIIRIGYDARWTIDSTKYFIFSKHFLPIIDKWNNRILNGWYKCPNFELSLPKIQLVGINSRSTKADRSTNVKGIPIVA